jgi:hypothetical protein
MPLKVVRWDGWELKGKMCTGAASSNYYDHSLYAEELRWVGSVYVHLVNGGLANVVDEICEGD